MNKYMITTTIASLVSWSAVILVVFTLDPFRSAGIALPLFFLSLFFAFTTSFTIIGFYLKKYVNRNEILYNHINVSVRQAVLLSSCAIASIVLLMFGVLTWWNGALLVTIILLLEFYFSSQE